MRKYMTEETKMHVEFRERYFVSKQIINGKCPTCGHKIAKELIGEHCPACGQKLVDKNE